MFVRTAPYRGAEPNRTPNIANPEHEPNMNRTVRTLQHIKTIGRSSPHCRHAHVDIKARADRTRARTVPGLAARPVDSLATVDRPTTATRRPTHQRAPQRLCHPGRFPSGNGSIPLRTNSVRHQHLALSRSANSLCWGHIGRDLRARTASATFTLVVGALAGPISMEGPNRIPKSRGEGEKQRPFRNFICHLYFAPPLSRTLGAQTQRMCTAARHCRP